MRVADRRDGHIDLGPDEEHHHKRNADAGPKRRIEDRPGPENVLPDRNLLIARALIFLVGQRHIVDQTARLANLLHDVIASVDAERAGNAFQLLAVANINPDRADIDAGIAIDAVAKRRLALTLVAILAAPARLTAPIAIGNRDRVLIHHRGLNTRPGAHIDADLFAHEPAKDKGGRGQNADGGVGHGVRLKRDEIDQKRRGVCKVEHPGPASGHRNGEPGDIFGDPKPDFLGIPTRFPEPKPGVSVALNPALNRKKEIGPNGLRAGITAPDPPKRRREEEEAETGHDQKARNKIELVRPDLDPEEEEAPVRHVDQHGLIGECGPAIPPDPGGDVVDPQGHDHNDPFEIAELTGDPFRKNRFAGGVELLWLFRGTHDGTRS